ncbi:MAG: hypothetical protein LC098_04160 [Burkholderiales bacterium]|nr:hypothetical protein [Burkholderiales bacterium]
MSNVTRKTFFQPNPRVAKAATIYEADLAELLSNGAIRQLVISWTAAGWSLQAMPTWKQEFMTLVSLKKETRHYQSLDRLIESVTKHGRMPPTLLIGTDDG